MRHAGHEPWDGLRQPVLRHVHQLRGRNLGVVGLVLRGDID